MKVLTWVVVKATAHKVAILARVFASPSEFNILVDLLNVSKIEMRLSCLEIPKPFLYFPHILFQYGSHPLVVGIVFQEVSNRKHKGWWISF